MRKKIDLPPPAEPTADDIDALVSRAGRGPEKVMEILQNIQSRWGWLPQYALERVVERTDITPRQIAGVSSFFSQFRLRPVGRHVVRVCHGTACYVLGADRITDSLRRFLELEGEEDTDAQRVFTVEKVACLGCCSLAPCMMVDQVTYGHLTPRSAPEALEAFLEERE